MNSVGVLYLWLLVKLIIAFVVAIYAGRCRKTTSMSSDSGYSRTRDKGDEYGQGSRYPMTYTEQSTEKGMGIHPSIGRFSEKDQANPLHSKKPNVGATASKTYDGQSLATHSNHGTHQQDSASSDVGGIVNLRSPSSTEGKVRNWHNRESLFYQFVLLSTLI